MVKIDNNVAVIFLHEYPEYCCCVTCGHQLKIKDEDGHAFAAVICGACNTMNSFDLVGKNQKVKVVKK